MPESLSRHLPAGEVAPCLRAPELEAFRTVPPFAESWIPFVRAVRGGAWGTDGPAAFAAGARATLEGLLLADLSFLGARALSENEDAGGLARVLDAFPELARLSCSLVSDWVEATAELVARLEADRVALAEAFGAAGEVVSVSAGLSDRHRGGRRVVVLAFASGARVVYKPRPVGLEAEWNGFLGWLRVAGAPDPPPALRFVARDGYGWAEFAAGAPLADEAAADAYFRSAGSLLAAAWLLGARDGHMDNVVAAPAGPVVVDAEAFLQPDPRAATQGRGAFDAANARLAASFLSTGLLALEETDSAGRLRDVGGLNGGGGPGTASANLPMLHGRRLLAEDRLPAVLQGFTALYRFLLSHRSEIHAPGGPLSGFGSHRVRMVFRPSAAYARILDALASRPALRDGQIRNDVLDALRRPFNAPFTSPDLRMLVADERASLERLDVPVFEVGAAETGIVSASGARIEGCFARSGVDAMRDRLARMGDEDLAAQARLLTATLTRGASSRAPAADSGAGPGSDDADSVGRGEFEAEAVCLADAILGDAVSGEDGGLVWIDPAAVRRTDRSDRGASYYLYDGGAGVMLFFAAAAAATGLERFRDAARRSAIPLQKVLDAPQLPALVAAEGLGVCHGVGSLVYALSVTAGLLGEEWPLELARRAAALVTDERLERDALCDVEGGASGAVLGLLALHAATGDEAALGAAVRCGEHVLARHRVVGDGAWGWPNADGHCLAGLAHGSGGIALALSRLAAATGRGAYGAAAHAAFRHEATLFDESTANWPVPAKDGDTIRRLDMKAWCHGAPGIALARLAARGLGNRTLDGELETALETTRRTGLLSLDHLCCGNAGLVEALFSAGRALGRPGLVADAETRLGSVLARARRSGGYRLRATSEESGGVLPGFFRGRAGLGYTLLRLARPGLLPNVLVFEAGERVAPAEGVGAVARPEPDVRFEGLAPPVDPRLARMTFPAYRRLLDLGRAQRHPGMAGQPWVKPLALGAWAFGEPAALALAEIPEGQSARAEILSLFVAAEHRGRGLGGALLAAAERALARMGVEEVQGVYMTGQPGQPALERLLIRAGWSAPETRQLTMRFTPEGARRMEWFGRYPFGDGFEVFPWKDLTDEEREGLRASQRATGWIKPDLEPWRHDAYGFEPVSSIGIRLDGEIVGWVINHALDERTVRFTCSFIRKDLGRRGKIVPAYTEAVRRLSEGTSFVECSLTVPVRHGGMSAFVLRRCAPHALFIGETRGTAKRLAAGTH